MFASIQHEQINKYGQLHIKDVGAYICLFDNQAYHSPCKKQTEKHPRWSI